MTTSQINLISLGEVHQVNFWSLFGERHPEGLALNDVFKKVTNQNCPLDVMNLWILVHAAAETILNQNS